MSFDLFSRKLKHAAVLVLLHAYCHCAHAQIGSTEVHTQIGSIEIYGDGQVVVDADGTIHISGGSMVVVSSGSTLPSGDGYVLPTSGVPILSLGGVSISSAGAGSVSLSGGTITLTNQSGINTQGGSLQSAGSVTITGSVTVAGSATTTPGDVITLQSQTASLDWNDARITRVSFANLGSSQDIPVVTRITALPADTQYGVVVSGNGSTALYRAGSGAIDPIHATNSIAATSVSGQSVLSAVGTVPNGAHSRPLQYRTAVGKKLAWVAGDVGADKHSRRDGDLALGEVGVGHNLGSAQINLAVGRTQIHQSAALNGRTRAQGNYLLAESLIPLNDAFWLTLGVFSHWGETHIRRGYLNMGTPDISSGSPDTDVHGLRVRLDWENALTIGQGAFSPYVDLMRTVSKMHAYTERSGGFPARLDAHRDQADELRIGTYTIYPLSSSTRFVGLGELAHRFQKRMTSTSGEVVGLFAFDVPGQSARQNWLRLGAGLESTLGDGLGAMMLNITTQGSTPSAWLAMSYQFRF